MCGITGACYNTVIKDREGKGWQYALCMGEIKNANNILKTWKKRPLGRLRHKWNEHTKLNITNRNWDGFTGLRIVSNGTFHKRCAIHLLNELTSRFIWKASASWEQFSVQVLILCDKTETVHNLGTVHQIPTYPFPLQPSLLSISLWSSPSNNDLRSFEKDSGNSTFCNHMRMK
jgi:hypothetical protein